jgi:hypothetical protein
LACGSGFGFCSCGWAGRSSGFCGLACCSGFGFCSFGFWGFGFCESGFCASACAFCSCCGCWVAAVTPVPASDTAPMTVAATNTRFHLLMRIPSPVFLLEVVSRPDDVRPPRVGVRLRAATRPPGV